MHLKSESLLIVERPSLRSSDNKSLLHSASKAVLFAISRRLREKRRLQVYAARHPHLHVDETSTGEVEPYLSSSDDLFDLESRQLLQERTTLRCVSASTRLKGPPGRIYLSGLNVSFQ